MLMKEVLERTGLTKKAVEYYEKQGLVRPGVLENGYRDYDEAQLRALREITVLRGLGLSVAEAGRVLEDRAALGELVRQKELGLADAGQKTALLKALSRGCDFAQAEAALRGMQEAMAVKEKMLLAFPGGYGAYLALHFGRFLGTPIETDEQRAAYARIVAYWDEAADFLDDELAAQLEEAMQAMQQHGMEETQAAIQGEMQQMLSDPAAYVQQRGEELGQYLEYRTSEAFYESEAGRMLQRLLAFQQSSGYKEVFLANMRALSPAYDDYCGKLAEADAALAAAYPQAEKMYE